MFKTFRVLCLFFVCLFALQVEAQTFTSFDLPFSAGTTWKLGNGYHQDIHFPNDNPITHVRRDAYALDFNLGGSNEDLGQPILAVYDGTVKSIHCPESSGFGYGCNLWIEHDVDGTCYLTHYAHLQTTTVDVGPVSKGEQVGILGTTGTSPAHLHWSVRPCPKNENPLSSYSIPPLGMDGYDWEYRKNPVLNPPIEQSIYQSSQSVIQFRPIGYFETSGFEAWLNSNSFAVANAHRKNAVASKKLARNPGNDGGGIYLHQWGSYDGLLIQNFLSSEYELNGAIMMREGSDKAYAVRAGFWDTYNNSVISGEFWGPQYCGAPLSEEGQSKKVNGVPKYTAIQKFETCTLFWDPANTSGQVWSYIDNFIGPQQVPQEDVDLVAKGLFFVEGRNDDSNGFIGFNDDTAFQIATTSIAFNAVGLTLYNGPGLSYDYIKIERDGADIALLPGNATNYLDSSVQAYAYSNYYAVGHIDGLGEIIRSNQLTVETPAAPGTFDVIGNSRGPSTIDITLVDTLHTSAIAHRIYRDSMVIASTTGDKYVDPYLVPSSTYAYQIEAITASGLSLGFSTNIQVSTDAPDGTEEIQPQQGAPANLSIPLRLVEGVEVVDPIEPVPHVISTCSQIRFVLEHVGTSPLYLDRVQAKATVVLNDGWGIVYRNFSPDMYQYPTPPLKILPGERYTYEGDNCDGNNPWPGLPGIATVIPQIKLYTIGGLFEITDIDSSVGYANFAILPSYTNPDFRVVDIRLVPAEPQNGDSISVELDIKNDGDADAGTFQTEITLPDRTVYSATSDQLQADETKTTTILIGTFFSSFNEINYWIDHNDAHYEWDESNNTGLFYFTVSPTPAECSDDIDNDVDGKIDWNDGINLNPDPNCSGPNDNREKRVNCGLGFEIAPFILLCVLQLNRKRKHLRN